METRPVYFEQKEFNVENVLTSATCKKVENYLKG